MLQRFSRIRLLAAGLVGFLLGFPLSDKTLGGDGGDIFGASLDLGLAIADSAGHS